MIFKTIVSKQGDIKSYINKPVWDKRENLNDQKEIGTIIKAVEIENGFELTIKLEEPF